MIQMDSGSNDPQDGSSQPQATAGPSPSPSASPSPFASQPANNGVSMSSSSGVSQQPAATTDPTVPPQDFVNMVRTAIASRLGGLTSTKFLSISAADMDALIAKIWNDPNIQNYYYSNHHLMDDPSTQTQFYGGMGNLISQSMQGQGADSTVVIDYSNMLTAAGVTLTAAEQQALSGATQAVNAPVPRPFDTSTISGYDFGAALPANIQAESGVTTQNGIDYGTPAGSRIVSPFAGTAHVYTGVKGYGNFVTVTLDNGWTIGFGHVAEGTVTNGERVNPGDLVAISGQNVGDSTGAVTILTWQNPQGQYVNPHSMIDPIFSGATFSSIGAAGAAGTGYPTVNAKLDTEYPFIKENWTALFGSPPSPEDVYNVLNHGQTPQQQLDYMRSFPSHVGNLTQGQYSDLRKTADTVSGQVLGHPATDGIVSELSSKGYTSEQAVKTWYDWNGASEVPKDEYNDIYKSVVPTMSNIFNEPSGADPRDIRNIYNAQGKQRQTGGQVGQ